MHHSKAQHGHKDEAFMCIVEKETLKEKENAKWWQEVVSSTSTSNTRNEHKKMKFWRVFYTDLYQGPDSKHEDYTISSITLVQRQ